MLIVANRYYEDVADLQMAGALAVLEPTGSSHDVLQVPGALEIPAAILYAVKALDFDPTRRRFDGYIALGCIVKGSTHHDEIIGFESARGLQDLALQYTLAIGNGILTCNTHAQALERADPAQQDRGGAAAVAALRMIEIKQQYRLTPKRRWLGKA